MCIWLAIFRHGLPLCRVPTEDSPVLKRQKVLSHPAYLTWYTIVVVHSLSSFFTRSDPLSTCRTSLTGKIPSDVRGQEQLCAMSQFESRCSLPQNRLNFPITPQTTRTTNLQHWQQLKPREEISSPQSCVILFVFVLARTEVGRMNA